MIKYTRNLAELMPRKVLWALSLMVLISLNEAINLIILIPLLQLVGLDVGQGSLGQIAEYVSSFFTFLELQPKLITVLTIYVIVISSSALLTRYQTLKTSEIQYQFAAHLRKRLYTVITNSNWLFFSKMKSSNFAHALTNEIDRISMGTGQFLTFISGIMILVVYIIFALKLAGIISGVIFMVGVAILLLLRRMASRSRSRGEEITTTTRDLYYLITQHLDGMQTIKSFDMEEENVKLFSKQADNVAERYLNAIRSYADVKLLFDIGTVVVLAVMVLVLIQVIQIPTATLLILIYIFVRMIPRFSSIQNSYQYFITMLPAFANVKRLEKECLENSCLEDELEIQDFNVENESIDMNGKRVSEKKSINGLILSNVLFSYSDKSHFILKNFNLRISVGKTTAIVGQSGAGKSTIADLVMGLIRPDEGDIIFNGKSISHFPDSWRQKIGYVAQDTFLFNESIRFNLLIAKPEANEQDLIDALEMASANEFVSKLTDGLDTLIGDRGVRLSGGERQRLALARALLRKPSLLILDEATSNLDSDNEKKILRSIDDLHGEITILMIAHRISTIKNADYIYLMAAGGIVESGTWDDLLKNKGKFWNVCEVQGLTG
ncbi:MAG: ABC transporter ATP-binding protein [Methanobacterium sp.]